MLILHQGKKSGDRYYFGDEAGYQRYLEAERKVAQEPLPLEFDWRLLFAVIFGRLS